MLPLYRDPHFTFRFADERLTPRFHLEAVEAGHRVSVFKMDPATGERQGLLATGMVGEGGWVDLAEPIIVKAGEAFVAVPGFRAVPTTRNLATLIVGDLEVRGFCGPFEVFTVANRFTEPPAFHVFTLAETPGAVLTRGGLSVNPHHRLPDCPRPDLLLVPGGQGTRREMHNAALTEWIKARSQEAELVLSVCTGALLLAKAGLLDGLEATTHHGTAHRGAAPAPPGTPLAHSRLLLPLPRA
jgi:putative intracellular protease/amidase